MNILGISAYYHDSAACLLQQGRITAAAQEERFSRIKHDPRFPKNAAAYCLETAGITADDLDLVAFYDKPFLKFERLLETYLEYAPRGIASFITAMPGWIKQKLWIRDRVRSDLDYKGKVLFPEHHESHAAAAFFPSPFAEAAFLTMDGVGEWATTSWGTGCDNRIEIAAELHFPHSLGLLYSAFTYYTGFRVNSGEYKLMGLAPYGEPKYVDEIKKELIDIKDDGSFHLNMDYFNYCSGLTMTGDRFHRLFGGPPRQPESDLTQKDMDLARSVQEVTEEVVLSMAGHVRAETGMRHLCLSGGVALNCVANGKLLRTGLFDDIWIQPAAGDAGGALGAAQLAWHHHSEQPRKVEGSVDSQFGSLLGPEFSDDEISRFLTTSSLPFTKLAVPELPGAVAELLGGGKVVGWFQGRMEFGPRALGSRSILGDARSAGMQETMNLKIKFRESFRPFAPSVLAEKSGEWFDSHQPSPYMLLVADVNAEKLKELGPEQAELSGLARLGIERSKIPAVTHVDNSARLQTVHSDTNPRYHALITEFDRRYGCPVIINTSFNVRGEPIVCTPEDAYRCFMRTDMDYLVLGNFLLDKSDQPAFVEDEDWRKTVRPD